MDKPTCNIKFNYPNDLDVVIVTCDEPGNVREFARDAHGELFQSSLGIPIVNHPAEIADRFKKWGETYNCTFIVV